MTHNLDFLIPFVVHKDEVVRQYVARYFLCRRAFLTKNQKKLLIGKIFLSLKSFGLFKNQDLIDLLSFFKLSSRQLKDFYFLYRQEKKLIKSRTNFDDSRRESGFVVWTKMKKKLYRQLSNELKKIFFFYSINKLHFLRDFLPLSFWNGYFNYTRYRFVFRDIFEYHSKSTEDDLWSFLKEYFLGDRDVENPVFEEKYLRAFLKILSDKFSGKYTHEIRNFFFQCLTLKGSADKNYVEKKEVDRFIVQKILHKREEIFFYLHCVEVLQLRDIAQYLFDFFLIQDCPKDILLRVAKVLASFSRPDFDAQMFELYSRPDFSSLKKEVIIAFFSFSTTSAGEKYLLRIGDKEEDLKKRYKVANALAHLFSKSFVPYAIDLCRKDSIFRASLAEKIVVFSSILGARDQVYFPFASQYFQKNFNDKIFDEKILHFDQ